MKTIVTENLPIKTWAATIDENTLNQAKNLANLPFAYKHIAIMPDAHVGYGMPIGGVAAMKGIVIPNAVGVDIGCGVAAVQTSLSGLDTAQLKKMINEVRKSIPLGFKHHKRPQSDKLMPDGGMVVSEKKFPVMSREYQKGRMQLGTLGGGNHFIEIQKGDDGYIWIMIHSGSRNVGYQVAGHYNQLAKEYNSRHGQKVPSQWQLDYLPVSTKNGTNYLREMEYCVHFAEANRREMMRVACAITTDFNPGVTFSEPLDIAHNYAAREHHFGEDVIVHRKGATRATEGAIGIIPGSQGSSSFIVNGRGNLESFSSCSHGAGRKLGRKQAQKKLDLQLEIEKLESQGILHSIRHKKNLDEAAGAYKNIEEVMANQQDLVEIITRLQPLAVVKG
ncbi:MAG: RtcB family protein [Desulfobulbaceae bacterium]|nr:RtcB family protein [Desulfobulbaceae bacterium]